MALKENHIDADLQWVIMEATRNGNFLLESSESICFEETAGSSSCSIENDEDDASSSNCCEPLYELSQLMAHLPIKRGLSKYYQGKSRSFGHLRSVNSLKDLPKNESSYNQKKRRSSSFGPKATITKNKSSRRPILSSLACLNTRI